MFNQIVHQSDTLQVKSPLSCKILLNQTSGDYVNLRKYKFIE